MATDSGAFHAQSLPKTHDSQSAASLERVTDYAEEKEIVGDFGKVVDISCVVKLLFGNRMGRIVIYFHSRLHSAEHM